MKWLLAVALVGLLAVSVAYGLLRREMNAAAEQAEQQALQATRAAREAVSAESRKGADEIARWKATAARYEAETRRLASAAKAAAKEVESVKKAGDVLRAAPADDVLRECARQGYQCRMAAR